MARLKALPKALIVGAVIAAIGFAAYQFMPKQIPEHSPPVAAQPAPTPPPPPVVAQPAPAPTPAPAPAPEPQKVQIPEVQKAIEAAREAPTPPANTNTRKGAGIASGQPTGTYYPITDDIVKTCSTSEYPLRNSGPTTGTMDNINKVYTDPSSQFGIAQVDGLTTQQQIDPKMMSRILVVFPFYSEEIHAVTASGSPINSLADLAGKRVIEGSTGSGTAITVSQIKRLTGIKWEPVPGNLSQADGLRAVQEGRADAMFMVGGQPVQMFTAAQGIKLIDLSNPAIDASGAYTKTQFSSGAYPWQKSSVGTYKVDNALITFAFKNQYQKEIGDLVSCITRNLGQLQQSGHPKWRDVDPLDIERIKWANHPAAVAAIKRELKKQ